MTGISSEAAKGNDYPLNKKKYNGIDWQNDLGLNEYDAQLRDLDPQIGIWWQIDPKIEDMEMWSPYTSNYQNPIRYSDPLGDEGEDCCGGFLKKLAEAGDRVMISASGLLGGALNTLSGGVIPTDLFNNRRTYNDDEKRTFDNSVMWGQYMPLIPAGGRRPVETVPELIPAGPKTNTEIAPSTPEIPLQNRAQSNSNSSSSTSTKYQEPPTHSKAIKNIVKNASKPGVTLSDAKIAQLKRVVNQSGGTVRTEIGVKGSVKDVKHSQVEGYGTKTSSRHIIHTNQN